MSTRRPDPEHDAVCASTARRRVVIAPPGAGKTHLAVRVAGSLAATLPAGPLPGTTLGPRVLLLTFSKQARVQLEREVVRQLDPQARQRVVVSNYHALFWSAVRAHRRVLGLPQELEVVGAKRRIEAFTAANVPATKQLGKETGLLEAFAEQAFLLFHDERTPASAVLEQLLAIVASEQCAGRLLFDDFGALFWQLLERFPVLEAAYRSRFPVVIADEHQDASALQDAVVRRLATQTLIVLADPLQLIHGYRGARDERLEAHLRECGPAFELSTPHRWHHQPDAGIWLLAVRARLLGCPTPARRPASVSLVTTRGQHGFNGVLAATKRAVADAFAEGTTRVAVLVRRNDQVGQMRRYLSRNGLFPYENAGSADFEAARADIEALTGCTEVLHAAQLLVKRLGELVPTLEAATLNQVKSRLTATGPRTTGAGTRAKPILEQLSALYRHGPGGYFAALVATVDACLASGHHTPHSHTLRVLRDTATRSNTGELADALVTYGERATRAAATTVGRDERGLYVMNAHQAKGKEFHAVIVADATSQAFPDTFDGRRLFYVALTRASSRWTFITPDHQPSPLLELLG